MITTLMNKKRGLPDDGDLYATNNLLKPGAIDKHQLNPGGPNTNNKMPVEPIFSVYDTQFYIYGRKNGREVP